MQFITLLRHTLASLLFWLLISHTAMASSPRILVTIKPLHSLVSGLTKGISQPTLLLNGMQSPHDYSLRPSDRRHLARSDFIIYASPSIESFMPAIIASLDKKIIPIAASDIPGIGLLEARKLQNVQLPQGQLQHGQLQQDDHGHQHKASIDGHLWMSVDNAITMVDYLAQKFAQYDPQHRHQYQQNRSQLIIRLNQLKGYIKQHMTGLENKAYLNFHDAFQYFEFEFGLQQARFVTISPEHKIGIRHLHNLKQTIEQQNIQCIFYEPPAIPKIIDTLTEHHPARVLPLEPLGSQLKAGPDLYFKLLKTTTDQIFNCLNH